ncbi:unnamed protein product [Owenia fusiformis]|uniref:UDP-glucuronosyltransferase n=1 Tax=Owenia fusiformis TaxID=6347 RepID=A0A8S4NNI9_OWEFU|nr:unnamed protein product [Owenia fusiformis]
MSGIWLLSFCNILLALIAREKVDGGKVFIQPFSSSSLSRKDAMEKIADILADAGHNVTFLAHTEYKIPETFTTSGVNVLKYNFPKESTFELTEGDIDSYISTPILGEMGLIMNRGSSYERVQVNPARSLFGMDMSFFEKMKEAEYDVAIFDSVDVILGGIMQKFLNRPTIMWSNTGYEFTCVSMHVPLSLSTVPSMFTEYSDSMTFMERFYNVFYHLAMRYYTRSFLEMKFDFLKLYGPKLGLSIAKDEDLCDADLLLAQSSIAYFYPRPLMPNVIPVLGLKDKKSNPINSPFKEFIDGAGEHGFIILSFGSLPKGMDEEKREIFASVFAKLKQRVIWRYGGPTPKSLGPNTMLVPWIPQNDMLGHPNVRAFITHCGVSGSAEAVFKAVPVIGIPLFFDQRQHCTILTKRHGMGKVLFLNDITVERLTNALLEVLNNPKYKTNALKAQELARDQPINASYTIQYWVEYVMKHKGADHLKSTGMRQLNFFQYFLLDILFVVIGCVTMVILAMYCILRRIFIKTTQKIKLS